MSDLSKKMQQLANNATKGPWWDARNWFQSKHAKRMSNGNWRAKAGRKIRDTWALLICAPGETSNYGANAVGGLPPKTSSYDDHQSNNIGKSRDEWDVDEFDFQRVVGMRWSQIKGTMWSDPMHDDDAAFIAAARCGVPALCAEIETLESKLAVLEKHRALFAEWLASHSVDVGEIRSAVKEVYGL